MDDTSSQHAQFEGSRHDLILALTGALHHAGWSRADIENLLTAVLKAVDDPERRDRVRAVIDTFKKAEAGQPITGWPRAAELLGDAMARCLGSWWNLGNGNVAEILTFGGKPADQAPDITWAAGLDWPQLLEFESSDHYTGEADQCAAYPVAVLEPILGPAILALAERQQVPIALAAQSCLAAAAAVVQERLNVLCDGRTIPLSLWLVLVAVPGERKTTTDAEAFDLIHLRMKEAEVRYQVALAAWLAAKKDGKNGDPGPPPRKPSWLLTDCTTEGLLKTLSNHWSALTLTNSDAASWVSGYSMREGRDSATGAAMSNLWSGAYQSFAKASQDAPVTLHRRRLSLSLMLQPEVAAALFENRTLAGQGFLSRCLPAFPPSQIGSRPHRRRTDDPRLDRFHEALDTLLAKPPELNLITGELNPRPLHLDDDAFDAWAAVHDHMEADLVGNYKDISEVANKAPDQVLRLAGLQAALDGAEKVRAAKIQKAAQLVDWYLSEWQRLSVRLVEHRREVALPRQLLDWMQQRRAETGQDLFKLRDIYKSGPRMVRGLSQQAQELMNELLRRGYVRMQGTDYQLRPDEI